MINTLRPQLVEQQRQWFRHLIDHAGNALLGQHISWFNHLREDAKVAIMTLPPVHRKQEFWRYSQAERLFKIRFDPTGNDLSDIQDTEPDPDVRLSDDSVKLVFVNGQFISRLSDTLPNGSDGHQRGVIASSFQDALKTHPELLTRWFKTIAGHNEHLFTALNTALMNYGMFIHIGKNIEMDRPIEVLYLSRPVTHPAKNHALGDNKSVALNMATLRNLIVLEAGAKVTLIERFIGEPNSEYFNNNLVDVVVGDGASFHHSSLQDESRTAFHLSNFFLSLFNNSVYQGLHLALGGTWSRTDYNINFKETGAKFDLKGLYTVGNQQLNDIHLKVKHSAAGCTSRELFKGILYGEGRAIFDGHVVVAEKSQYSDATMNNDNLILSRNAEVDTKPQLEIYADNVKCSHGTTVGQLDDQQLFYLNSRGIDQNQAKQMLCLGFANEIIEAIDDPVFRKYVGVKLTETLQHAVAVRPSEALS